MKRIVSFFGDRNEVFDALNERAKAHAASLGFEYEWIPQLPFDEERVIEALRGADAGIIDIEPYGESIFSRIGDRPKILVRFGVGYDKVDLAAASRNGIKIARTTGANTTGVAEMAMTLILSCRRKINAVQRCVQSGKWEKIVANETIGSTVGIVGFGAIGRRLARLLSGFDCRIVAYDPFPNRELAESMGVELVGLEELFTVSDAISIHVPYGPETHFMVGEALLGRMKPDAVLVNTARGRLVDENALYEALKERRIGGAGFDVFEVEPLPLSSPLIGLDNVVLTPHVSSQTIESLWSIYRMAVDISADFHAGKGSPHILNP